MSLIGMRYLEPPHIIVRKGLIAGIEYPLLAEHRIHGEDTLFHIPLSFHHEAQTCKCVNLNS